MTLPSTTQHLVFVDPHLLNKNFTVAGAPMHGLNLAHFGPSFMWQVNNEGGIACLGDIRIFFGSNYKNCEICSMGI